MVYVTLPHSSRPPAAASKKFFRTEQDPAPPAGVKVNAVNPVHSVTTSAGCCRPAHEEGVSHISLVSLLFYGNPRYVEWLMASIRIPDGWLTNWTPRWI